MLPVLVPYVRLSARTKEALEAEGYRPIYQHTPGDYGYADALETMWSTGQGFVVVEQDKVPWPGAVADLWKCSALWCVYPCRMDNGEYAGFPSLSTVKFSTDMVRLFPTFMSTARTYVIGDAPPGHYSRLDMAIFTHAMLGCNLEPHWHYPEVLHYHEEES